MEVVLLYQLQVPPAMILILENRLTCTAVPITAICLLVLLVYLEIHSPRTPLVQGLQAVDWLGCIVCIGGTVMLLLGLQLGGVTFPWSSAAPVCLIVLGFVAAVLFVIIESKVARYPIIPLRIFRNTSNLASFGVCFVHGFVFISPAYFLPLYFQAVLAATPLLSGVYLLVFSASLSTASLLTGALISSTGRYYLGAIRIGLVLMTLGVGLLIDLPDQASWPRIVLYQMISGFGSGPNFQAPLIALQAGVDPRDVSMATASFVFPP